MQAEVPQSSRRTLIQSGVPQPVAPRGDTDVIPIAGASMLPPADLQTAFLMAVERLTSIVPALVGPAQSSSQPQPQPGASDPPLASGRPMDRGLLRVVVGLSVATSLVVVLGAWAVHERLGEHASAARTTALRDAMLDYISVQEERETADAAYAERQTKMLDAIALKLGIPVEPRTVRPDLSWEVKRIRRSIEQP